MKTRIVLLFVCNLLIGDVLGEECETTEIMKCLPVFGQSGERDPFPDTAHKLREYCKHLMSGLDCARNLIDSCASAEERQVYHNLTHDMVGMNVALCTQGSPLNNKFLKHVGCYRELTDKFKSCSDRYIGNIVVVHGLTHEEQIKMTCCTVHEYNRCMRNVVEGRCEKEAQELVQETVLRSLTSSFKYCDQIRDVPTSNCMKMLSETQGHATGSLDDRGGKPPLDPCFPLLVMVSLMVSALVSFRMR